MALSAKYSQCFHSDGLNHFSAHSLRDFFDETHKRHVYVAGPVRAYYMGAEGEAKQRGISILP